MSSDKLKEHTEEAPKSFYSLVITLAQIPQSRKERAIVSLVSSALVMAVTTLAGVIVSIVDLGSNFADAKVYVVPVLIVLLAGLVFAGVFHGVIKFYRRRRQERERALGAVIESEKEFFQKIEHDILELVQ